MRRQQRLCRSAAIDPLIFPWGAMVERFLVVYYLRLAAGRRWIGWMEAVV